MSRIPEQLSRLIDKFGVLKLEFVLTSKIHVLY